MLKLEQLEHRLLLAAYYVSPSGDDDAAGNSPEAAWRTAERVNRQDFEPGDAVRFEGGAGFDGGLFFGPDDDGTADAPITVSSFGEGRATIQSGLEVGLFLQNTGGFEISNLNFVGPGMRVGEVDGILISNDLPGDVELRHVHITEVEVSQYGFYGINVAPSRGLSGFRDVRITHAELHHNLEGGLLTQGPDDFKYGTTKVLRDVFIGHVHAYENVGNLDGVNHEFTGNGIVVGGVDGGVVERSRAHDNGETGQGNVGIIIYNSNDVTVQFNESYHNRTTLEDGGGFDFDWGVTNSVMQYNYSHDNDGFGFLVLGFKDLFVRNVTVRYNVSENDTRTNFASVLLHGIEGAEIYNNTVYLDRPPAHPEATAVLLWGNFTGVRFRNNIFQTAGGVPLITALDGLFDTAGFQFQGNAYWSGDDPFRIESGETSYTSLEDWRDATAQETLDGVPVGHQVDPRLAAPGQGGIIGDADLLTTLSAYRLRRTSPLKDAGLDLIALFGVDPGAQDFYGNSLAGVTAFAVGAHEPKATPGFDPLNARRGTAPAFGHGFRTDPLDSMEGLLFLVRRRPVATE